MAERERWMRRRNAKAFRREDSAKAEPEGGASIRARRPAEPQGKRFERNAEMTRKLVMMAAALAVAIGAWADTETVGGRT